MRVHTRSLPEADSTCCCVFCTCIYLQILRQLLKQITNTVRQRACSDVTLLSLFYFDDEMLFSVHIAYCTDPVHILQDETGVLLSSGSFSRKLCPFSSKWEECQISVTLQWQDPQHECSQMHFWVSSDTLFYSFELSGTLLIYSELWRRCEWHLNFRGWTWVPSLGALWALSSTQPLVGIEIAGVDLRVTTSLAARSSS